MEDIPKIKTKKNKTSLLIFIILTIIIAVVIFYYIIVKFGSSNFDLSNYLKHPDKIPATALEESKNISNKDKDNKSLDTSSTQKVITPHHIVHESSQVPKNNNIQENVFFSSSYKNFLKDTNLLIINFLQDRPYTEFLDRVRPIYLIKNSKKINNILEMLAFYNFNYLVNTPNLTEPVINNEKNLINRFVKIEKTTDALKNKEELKSKIIKMLDILINYNYSSELENIFINNSLKENE